MVRVVVVKSIINREKGGVIREVGEEVRLKEIKKGMSWLFLCGRL